MATQTQRNFKKQMKEIEKEKKKNNKEDVYSYVHRDNSSRIIFTKRRTISISAIIFSVYMVFVIYSNVRAYFFDYDAYDYVNQDAEMQMDNRYVANGPVIDYLIESKDISDQLVTESELLIGYIDKINTLNNENKKDFIMNMSSSTSKMQQMLVELKNIEKTKELEQTCIMETSMYENLINASNNYLNGIINNDQKSINSGNEEIRKYNDIRVKHLDSLVAVLEKNNIDYERKDNELIYYWNR